MTIKRASCRGFTITEILITLGLLGTFAVVATHLFTGSFKLFGQNARSIETPIRFDAAIGALRADMESSSAIELTGADSLVIHDRAGGEVRWKADGKQLSRDSSVEKRSWEVGQKLRFIDEGDLLLVHPADSIASTADIALVPGGKINQGER